MTASIILKGAQCKVNKENMKSLDSQCSVGLMGLPSTWYQRLLPCG